MNFFTILTLMVLTTHIYAQDKSREFAVEWSPIHLVGLSVYEFALEVQVEGPHTVTAIFGKGTYQDPTIEKIKWDILEYGAQYRYYLGGEPSGFHGGLELLNIETELLDNSDITIRGVRGTGLAIGPMVGYKSQWDFGLVFNSQAGYQVIVAQAEAAGVEASEETGIFLLNLNVGWAF